MRANVMKQTNKILETRGGNRSGKRKGKGKRRIKPP